MFCWVVSYFAHYFHLPSLWTYHYMDDLLLLTSFPTPAYFFEELLKWISHQFREVLYYPQSISHLLEFFSIPLLVRPSLLLFGSKVWSELLQSPYLLFLVHDVGFLRNCHSLLSSTHFFYQMLTDHWNFFHNPLDHPLTLPPRIRADFAWWLYRDLITVGVSIFLSCRKSHHRYFFGKFGKGLSSIPNRICISG